MVIRPLVEADIDLIAGDARKADIEELADGAGETVARCLQLGLAQSLRTYVIWHEGKPLAALGDTMHAIGVGVPWMVGTNSIVGAPRQFLKASKLVLGDMLTRHARLYNLVDDRNVAAIRWLEWLGFEMGEPQPAGIKGMPFRQFVFDRDR